MPEPTITSKNLPPSQQGAPVPQVEKTLTYDQIEARPLRSPNFLNLKPKNPNMSLYFGNRAVGEKESGLRFDQLIAMGFRPAKPDEILTAQGDACPPSIQRDGRIMYGDLILLIISKQAYLGATKWNAESAERRVRRFGSTAGTPGQDADRANPSSALGDISGSRAAREGKIAAYIPKIADTDSKIADNSGIPANLAEK